MENNIKKHSLFGPGIVIYGLFNLLIRHPKDFMVLSAHICSDYIFEQFKYAKSVKYVDSNLENVINPQSSALSIYLSSMPFLIGSMGFLKWQFGNKVRQDICLFMRDITDLFSDAGYIFDNAPTTLRFRQSPGFALKFLHFFDRPRNCFPSLHVMLAAYTYLKTKELINKHSHVNGAHSGENNFLFGWSLSIIGSCLLTKQHSFYDSKS